MKRCGSISTSNDDQVRATLQFDLAMADTGASFAQFAYSLKSADQVRERTAALAEAMQLYRDAFGHYPHEASWMIAVDEALSIGSAATSRLPVVEGFLRAIVRHLTEQGVTGGQSDIESALEYIASRRAAASLSVLN